MMDGRVVGVYPDLTSCQNAATSIYQYCIYTAG